jgi:hypothetical protein
MSLGRVRVYQSSSIHPRKRRTSRSGWRRATRRTWVDSGASSASRNPCFLASLRADSALDQHQNVRFTLMPCRVIWVYAVAPRGARQGAVAFQKDQ